MTRTKFTIAITCRTCRAPCGPKRWAGWNRRAKSSGRLCSCKVRWPRAAFSQAEYSALMMGYDQPSARNGHLPARAGRGPARRTAYRAARWCTTQAGCACLTWRTRATPQTRWAAALLCWCVLCRAVCHGKNRRAMARVVCATPLGRSHTVKCKLRAARAGLRRADAVGRAAALLGGPAGLRPWLPVCAAVQPARLCRHAGASAYFCLVFSCWARAMRRCASWRGVCWRWGQRTGSTFGAMFAAALPLVPAAFAKLCAGLQAQSGLACTRCFT